jgi:Haem-binding domain
MRRKLTIAIPLFIIAIQFIRPTRNVSGAASPNEIGSHYTVPDEVHTVLKHSCYDCHSNNTVYPWYANVQPVGWWLQWHINDGKRHLNFSEFGSYPQKRAKKKFEEIEDATSNSWMPLDSYVWLHADTRLTPEQARRVSEWAGALK